MAQPKPKGAEPDDATVVSPDDMKVVEGTIDSGDGDTGTPDPDDGLDKDERAQGNQEPSTPDADTRSKPYPEPQSAEGAFVNEDGVDINTSADHTQNAQGNKYGTSRDAARGFRDANEAEGRTLISRLRELKTEYDKWDKEYQDAGGDEEGEDNSAENHFLAEIDADDMKPNNVRVRDTQYTDEG